jgi:hypothetical protein
VLSVGDKKKSERFVLFVGKNKKKKNPCRRKKVKTKKKTIKYCK